MPVRDRRWHGLLAREWHVRSWLCRRARPMPACAPPAGRARAARHYRPGREASRVTSTRANVGVRTDRRVWPDHEQYGVPSPGGWEPPVGVLPGWNWSPPGGLRPRLERMPRWARIWYRAPFIDRYAHAWMWKHGGWDVDAPAGPGPEASGVREPRRPRPTSLLGTVEQVTDRPDAGIPG